MTSATLTNSSLQMEGHLQTSPKPVYPTESDDVKYVSGLSTILVATIQEAKDSISQIEYIFCSQLFPNFQSKSKLLQKIYFEARKAAEVVWKEKENDLLLLIEELKLEKQQALEENGCLKLEKANSMKEQEDEMDNLHAKLRNQQVIIEELELKLMHKSKEVDEGMELQNKLLQLVQSKTSEIVNKGKQLKEHEDNTNFLFTKLNKVEEKVDELQEELREKTEETKRVKELNEKLFKKLESQALEIMNNEQLLNNEEKEKKKLAAKLQRVEENTRELQKELWTKTEEVEEGKRQMSCNISLKNSEILKHEEQLQEFEIEKKMFLTKVKSLEEKINDLEADHSGRNNDIKERGDLHGKLAKQIEEKTSELLAAKKKSRDLFNAYKRLKSQYNFLCTKFGLTKENTLSESKREDERDSLKHNQNQITSDIGDKSKYVSTAACDTKKVKIERNINKNMEDEKGGKMVPGSMPTSPISASSVSSKSHSTVKSASVAGTKRPAPSWRATRSRQGQGGPDPHDDFLDTPFENVRGNLNKELKDKISNSSDDETQNLTIDMRPEPCQMPDTVIGGKCFKFIEPVRKKAERENLKGIECKQCKKFYDAVLCDDEGRNTNNSKHDFRCEHHDGVSRHRYKYAPPLTPEGFWNIGFESEM